MTSDATSSSPPKNAALQERISHDADEQAASLHGWRQRYDQLSAGRFIGTLVETRFDATHVFRESTSQHLHQICEVPAGSCWFGIPFTHDRAGRIQSSTIHDDAIAFRPGGTEFELVTPPGYGILGVVTRIDSLRRHALNVEHVDLDDALPRSEVVMVNQARRAALAASLMAVLSASQHGPMESMILTWLFASGALRADARAPLPASSRRAEVAADARRYVLMHRDRAVNVPELCAHLHVSRRTLQYCFQEAFGMSPNVYLRAIRLNGARRALRTASTEATSVQDVAASWGFWHLSQFALDYRRLFGMKPSDTRAQGLATIDR